MKTYFIYNGREVKIGKSGNPELRLQELQVGSTSTLLLLGVIDGDFELEFHDRFAHDRIRGEWFKISYEMDCFIKYINAVQKRKTSVWKTGRVTGGKTLYDALQEEVIRKGQVRLRNFYQNYSEITEVNRVTLPARSCCIP